MKREKQIRSAAYEASMTEETIMRQEVVKDKVHVGYKDIKLRDSDRPIARLFFMEGVKWADANQPNPWISVEDRLPEATDKFGGSEDVLILDENGWRTVAMYCIPKNKWYLSVGAIQGDCEYPFEITHWMPIPELPKGE